MEAHSTFFFFMDLIEFEDSFRIMLFFFRQNQISIFVVFFYQDAFLFSLSFTAPSPCFLLMPSRNPAP